MARSQQQCLRPLALLLRLLCWTLALCGIASVPFVRFRHVTLRSACFDVTSLTALHFGKYTGASLAAGLGATHCPLAPAGRLRKRYGLAAHCTHTASLRSGATLRTQRLTTTCFFGSPPPPLVSMPYVLYCINCSLQSFLNCVIAKYKNTNNCSLVVSILFFNCVIH